MLKTLKIVSLTAIAYYFWILPANAQIFVGQGEGSAWTATGPTSNNDTLHQNMDIPGYNYVGKTADGQMVWERIDPGSSGGSTPTPNPDNGTNNPTTDNPTTSTTDSDCEVKQSGDDYTYCCKEEGTVETCETKGYQSGTSCGSGKTAKSYAITLNGQSKTCYKCVISVAGGENGGGCSNTCYSSCSANGGSVYYTQNDWHNSGGHQIYANGCNTGDGHCFCVKGATSGTATGLVVGPGGTGGGFGGGSSGPIQFQGDAIR